MWMADKERPGLFAGAGLLFLRVAAFQ